MCGISGIISKTNKKVSNKEIKQINDLIVHRGPDDEGYYIGDNFAFGHRRLSILDLTDKGHQPMSYMERYTITYNGEIYNYIEIKEVLEKKGYIFQSNTDTEVILASYDMWGEECVSKFNGMWAFALYDREKEIIFCSRDRFGIKPFYYSEINNRFIFGSEIKQLLNYYSDKFVNKKILINYLVLGLEEYSNETFFENIYKLEQSHNLIYDLKTHKFKLKKYYDTNLNNSFDKLPKDKIVNKYRETLENSIRLRLRSDVQVGTCLSGGLDSSAIASIASQIYHKGTQQKFLAIHAKSIEKNTDESNFAKNVADYCNLNLEIAEPTIDTFIKNIDEVIYTQEEPFGSPSIFMQYFVMKKAKELNCKVLLDGQGGDETLLGYERYYPAYLMSLNIFHKIKGLWYASKKSKLSIKQLILYFIYFTNASIRLKRVKTKYSFIKEYYMSLLDKKTINDLSANYLDIVTLQKQELFTTQLPHLLKYEDKNSMRNSIETRLPFIDYNLVETTLFIPNSYKIYKGWTKYILRESVKNILPKDIVWRKNKFGFEAPTKTWLIHIEEEMNNVIKDSKIIMKISQSIDFTKLDNIQKWKLYNIAKWEELFNVKMHEAL